MHQKLSWSGVVSAVDGLMNGWQQRYAADVGNNDDMCRR